MYRKLKNILGASLMALAVAISQIPMPDMQAENAASEKESQEGIKTDTQGAGQNSRPECTVTFSMNGGNFKGDYNKFTYDNKTPVLILDKGSKINIFPDEKYASYPDYKTEKDTWYTDRECLAKFDDAGAVSEDMTLFKKWYNITSDGKAKAEKGFHISANGEVLYRYDGGEELVEIPAGVTMIAENAFDSLTGILGIKLPPNIKYVDDNAFSGAEKDGIADIFFIFNSDTEASEKYGSMIAGKYDTMTYAGNFDPERMKEITGNADNSGQGQMKEIAGINVLSDGMENDASDTGKTGEKGATGNGGTDESSESGTSDSKKNDNLDETKPSGPVTVEPAEKKQYRVTYKTAEGNEGAENIPAEQTLSEDEKLEKPSQNPSVKDRIFKGWYTDAKDASTEYTSWGKTVTGDLTLYAVFEEKTNTVVFHMNGGGFTGNYKGASYTDAASLTAKITAGKALAAADYPENASARYSNYTTDSNWYLDKEGLNVYAKNDNALGGDLTLYKKWHYTSSGFTMNVPGEVLYKYSGSVADVVIPNSVKIIGADAFAGVGGISSITLPDNISDVKENAFSGANKADKDITVTGKTDNAKNMAKRLANQYKHLVYKDSTAETKKDSENSGEPKTESPVTTTKEKGVIKLGATIEGSTGATVTTNVVQAAAPPPQADKSGPSITLGAGDSPSKGTVAAETAPSGQKDVVSETDSSSLETPDKTSLSGQNVVSATVAKQNVTSASAPNGTARIKDSTPKTGDPLQYRMVFACAVFSAGLLVILTGNGRKRRASAS